MYKQLALILIIFCVSIQIDIFDSPAVEKRKTLKIWALSDIQPRNKSDRLEFENAVEDINDNIKDIDIALVAGDIVNRTEPETFEWYIQTKQKSYIKKWYEIAGNHDLKTDLGNLYKEYLNNNFHYSIEINNAVFLFMSDEQRGKPTEISEKTFNWWKEQVKNSQEKIIFVITHAPLNGSGIPFSSFKDRNIIDSDRFINILKNNIVDVWLSGHLHLPHSIKNNLYKNKELNNTVFLNISSIRPELLGFKDSESFIIALECGSNMILFQSRNHKKYEFNNGLEYKYQLSKPYKCSE